MTDPIRLSKRLAELLPCSRRDAELYIENGWVSVAGQVVEEPHARVTDEVINLHPDAKPTPVPPVTLLLHKPAGVDEDGARALLVPANLAAEQAGERTLRKHFSRLTQMAPLEPRASGLVIFTQAHGVTLRFERPLEEEYTVDVRGEADAEHLARVTRGVEHKGRPLPRAKVSWQSENRLRIALKSPRPGQLRQICEHLGLELLGLRRLRLGGVSAARLQPGQWRYLLPGEKF